jgi:hypothetical protein
MGGLLPNTVADAASGIVGGVAADLLGSQGGRYSGIIGYKLLRSGFGVERRWAAACSRGLRAFNVKIDHDGVLSTSYHDGLAGLVGQGVDFLVRHVGWDIYEVARSGFTAEFEAISPSHASPAANDEEDCFQIAVVVWTSLCVWLDHDRPCPQFAGSRSRVRDGGGPCHAGSLGCVGIQVVGWNDFDAVMLPVHYLHDSRILAAVSRDRPFSTCSARLTEA